MLAVVLVAGSAWAEVPTVSLTQILGPGTDGCPDARWLKQAVSARIGSDPFVDDGALSVEAKFSKAAPALVAQVKVTTKAGEPRGRRELRSETGDCLELASAVELAIALAIDPQHVSRPQVVVVPGPAVVTPVVVPPEPAPTPAPQPVEAPPVKPQPRASLGVLGALGVVPAPAPGLQLRFSLRWPSFSVGLEGRGLLDGSLEVSGGKVAASALLATAVGCFHVKWFGACAVVSAGALQVTTLIDQQRRESRPLVLAGGRASLEVPVLDWLSVEPFLDVQAALTRTTVLSGSTPVWVTSPVAGALGLSVGLHFP